MENHRQLTLRISEIFYSVQGEASRVGLPTVFVRLTGCPLRCVWCDTAYAFTGGETQTIGQILYEVAKYPTHHVCVSGGEPLAQKNCLPLLAALCDDGCDVSLETSGALDIAKVDPRVSRIMDLKAPDSGEVGRNRLANLAHLTPRDEVKIVIASRGDYDWAKAQLDEHALADKCPVLFSPVAGQLEPRQLAEWILADGLPVRFQVQLHKILWGNMQGK
ncbi:7-carboxy-7-deazaguanine synthase QueE [Oryzomicrobium sp.]|uniref:7-carboxy-7-deazaguanine synthase QueE n=1 Tax=Oryzomicrobium sp. TaxID=1911578 RepID=UPI0025FA70B1|nr:7-carboxy-7-deazaguanine synthase QueE [Oryzomicrobium sp.]MCE1243255.1 7-carboxy-7-deazaguanine synthase QueE [Oryzomicrobium sp.]